MEWYYAHDGLRRGPVSIGQLHELAQQGVVTSATLVWHEGLGDWRAFGSLGTELAMQACSECGRELPEADLMRYAQVWICAPCKPVFLQRLKEGARLPGVEIWRAGKRLVMYKDAVLPSRCVRCNASTNGLNLERRLYWHQPLLVLLLPFGCLFPPLFLVALILLIVLRRGTVVYVGLCERHALRRDRNIFWSWIAGFLGMAIFVAGFVWGRSTPGDTPGQYVGMAGFIVFIGAIVYGLLSARIVYPHRLDGERLWLGGAGREFLDSLPEWPGK